MRSHDSHMTHLSSSTWSQLYPVVNSTNGLKEQNEYWSSLKKQSQDQVITRLIPEKVILCLYKVMQEQWQLKVISIHVHIIYL